MIKVEGPPTGDRTRIQSKSIAYPGKRSPFFVAFNRGKKSIVLDLKKSRDRQIFERLLERADVLVENFRFECQVAFLEQKTESFFHVPLCTQRDREARCWLMC